MIDLQQFAFMVAAYLLGMAFAGSFLGRRWMGGHIPAPAVPDRDHHEAVLLLAVCHGDR